MTSETAYTKVTRANGTAVENRVDADDHNKQENELERINVDFLRWLGHVPTPGRRESTANANGSLNTWTIYDAASGGSSIETGVCTYDGSDRVSTIAVTRDGQTLTTTFDYTGGDIPKITKAVA